MKYVHEVVFTKTVKLTAEFDDPKDAGTFTAILTGMEFETVVGLPGVVQIEENVVDYISVE